MKKVIAQKEITEKLPKLPSFFTVEETNKLSDILKKIEFEDIIEDFAQHKS